MVQSTNNINPFDYNYFHAHKAASYIKIGGKKVLVAGCAGGNDCRYFVDLGAREVHGLDVSDEVSTGYQHPKVYYYRMSIENTSFKDKGAFSFSSRCWRKK